MGFITDYFAKMSSTELVIFWIGWAFTAITMTGTILNARQNKWGFVFWIIANIYFMICSFRAGPEQFPMAFVWVMNTFFSAQGLYIWSKKEKEEERKSNPEKVKEIE